MTDISAYSILRFGGCLGGTISCRDGRSGLGAFLGGIYEYICSVFTEILFGKVFWDYSAMPFNLGGRINLFYCFFWGIAAVVWSKGIYPKAARLIDIILKKRSIQTQYYRIWKFVNE